MRITKGVLTGLTAAALFTAITFAQAPQAPPAGGAQGGRPGGAGGQGRGPAGPPSFFVTSVGKGDGANRT